MGSLLVNLLNEWRSLKPPIASTSMLSGRKMGFYSIHHRKKSYLVVFSGQRISKWLETWRTTATAVLCQKQFFSLHRGSLRPLKPAFIFFCFMLIRFLKHLFTILRKQETLTFQFQIKGDDGLLLLKHNGIVVGGMFDSDNYNHNGLGQATLLALGRNDEVLLHR